ncbi:MAG: protein kinase, partial [Chthoniobacterales bacterium]|nr:protein kinase [Chthoniobacterales bacterium]
MSDGQIPIGRRIGKFVIEGQLGRGSRGVVWKARDENGFSVALKILQKECADFEEGFQKFQWETEILKRLNFPGIRRFVEFGEEADCVYLALEYVEGISLGDLVYEPIQENLLPLSQEHHLEELIERISKKWMNLSVIEKAAEAACRPQIGRSF